jgi:glycosyltransferase involved in cell wall biosynthesis
LLPRAINSVLKQTYQNFELIIVDDGSLDDTEGVMQLFRQDARVIYHKLEENKGVSAARNKGLSLARGKYVAFLDSDDELLPEALETAVSKFVELSPQGVKVIWFDCMDFMTKRVTGKVISRDGYMSYEDHLCDKIQGDFWVVVERNILAGLEFDERMLGERLLWLKLYGRTKVFHTGTTLYLVHREHGSTICSDLRVALRHKEKLLAARKAFLAEHGQEVRRLCASVYGRNLAALGFYQILNGERPEGRRALFESLRFSFSFGAVIVALLSYIVSESHVAFLYTKYKDIRYYLGRSRWLVSSVLSRKKTGAKR